ncbi:fibropellin-1-like [Branchiostoma floridae]|uniref:Fibropellin-1-like n=1 Tax=Branchiostoma floridae TaxID=7739 RepID=A0A9J7MPL0_BRAFL|nr:fibropellin-1-like [Branchiostoma floridae]
MFALCAKPSSCSSSPCVHGTCEDHETYYSCHDNCDHQPYYVCRCEPGWFGDRCHIYIDECQSSPCPQNATCVDHVNGYTCQCPPGFTGNSCETDINWCDPNPCPSGWVCADMPDAFLCQMPAGRAFSGDLCTAASCGPGWNCKEDVSSGYTCFRG